MSKEIEKQLKCLWEKVGVVVNLSQMVEYNLANILAFDEILREFEDRDSMFVFEYNELSQRANKCYNELSKQALNQGRRILPCLEKSHLLTIYYYIGRRNYIQGKVRAVCIPHLTITWCNVTVK